MDDLKAKLQRLVSKGLILQEKYEVLKEAKRMGDEALKEREQEIREMRKQIELLENENRYLKLARMSNYTAEEIAKSKAILTQMVRDVDKCISQLTD